MRVDWIKEVDGPLFIVKARRSGDAEKAKALTLLVNRPEFTEKVISAMQEKAEQIMNEILFGEKREPNL